MVEYSKIQEDRINRLSDEELINMIESNAKDYTEESNYIAKAIVKKRGGISVIKSKLKEEELHLIKNNMREAKEKELRKRMTKYENIRLTLTSFLQPGEKLQDYIYCVSPFGCLAVVAVLGAMISAALVTMFLFGPKAWPIFWILFFVFGTLFLSPLASKGKVVALTDRRLLVARMKTPLFHSPYITSVIKEYLPNAWPKAELSKVIRKFIFTLKELDSTLKLQLEPSTKNVEAARRILAEVMKSNS